MTNSQIERAMSEYENMRNYADSRIDSGSGRVEVASCAIAIGINLLGELGLNQGDILGILKAAASMIEPVDKAA